MACAAEQYSYERSKRCGQDESCGDEPHPRWGIRHDKNDVQSGEYAEECRYWTTEAWKRPAVAQRRLLGHGARCHSLLSRWPWDPVCLYPAVHGRPGSPAANEPLGRYRCYERVKAALAQQRFSRTVPKERYLPKGLRRGIPLHVSGCSL